MIWDSTFVFVEPSKKSVHSYNLLTSHRIKERANLGPLHKNCQFLVSYCSPPPIKLKQTIRKKMLAYLVQYRQAYIVRSEIICFGSGSEHWEVFVKLQQNLLPNVLSAELVVWHIERMQ